jgi:hypothetical protein
MAITNIHNSTKGKVYIGTDAATKIAYGTDATLNLQMDTRDITNKDSNGWRELLEGLRSWSISASFLYLYSANWGYADAFAAIVARNALATYFLTGEKGLADDDGANYYYGNAYETSGNLAAPNAEDNMTSDVNFEGTGPLSEGALPFA